MRIRYALLALLCLAAAQEEGTVPPREKKQEGKIYKHVVGFRMWHPAEWKVVEQPEFLQLVPPDSASTPDGPTEIYLVASESVEDDGITDPGDPRVAEHMDLQVRTSFPFLARSGGTEAVTAGTGKGALFRWKGNNPKGDAVEALAYVCILKKHGVALLAVGFPEPLKKRAEEVLRIFRSFGLEEGRLDKAIVGTWDLSATQSVTNTSPFETAWSRAQAVSETQSRLELRADGTWKRHDTEHFLAGAGGVWLESKDTTVREGHWFAGEGKLHLLGKDDAWEVFRYKLEPSGQLRTVSGKRGEIWDPAR